MNLILWTETLPRWGLGWLFLLAALDGWMWIFYKHHLYHPPTAVRGLAMEKALKETGFFWPLMKTIELIGGLSLVSNTAPAIGLALLMPMMTVIVFFQTLLNPRGWWIAVLLIVSGGLLMWRYLPLYALLWQ